MESYGRGRYSGMKLQQDKEIQLIDLCSGITEPGQPGPSLLCGSLLHLLDMELGWI